MHFPGNWDEEEEEGSLALTSAENDAVLGDLVLGLQAGAVPVPVPALADGRGCHIGAAQARSQLPRSPSVWQSRGWPGQNGVASRPTALAGQQPGSNRALQRDVLEPECSLLADTQAQIPVPN